MFLPLNLGSDTVGVDERLSRHLGISLTGRVMDKLRWLGLFDDEPCGCKGDTAAAMLSSILQEKLPLGNQRDMVVLKHQLDVENPDRSMERIVSTMVAHGEPGGFTAMSKSVGLPAAIGVKLLLTDRLNLKGTQIPTHPSIYEPVLEELAQSGLSFTDSRATLDND